MEFPLHWEYIKIIPCQGTMSWLHKWEVSQAMQVGMPGTLFLLTAETERRGSAWRDPHGAGDSWLWESIFLITCATLELSTWTHAFLPRKCFHHVKRGAGEALLTTETHPHVSASGCYWMLYSLSINEITIKSGRKFKIHQRGSGVYIEVTDNFILLKRHTTYTVMCIN